MSVEESTSNKTITFPTSDGATISADFHHGSNGFAVVLAHMLSRNRTAWGNLPLKLNEWGFTVLNIDLRGHGHSTIQNGHTINFSSFSETDFVNMTLDFAAAKSYLMFAGIDPTKVYYIGASIGANAVLVAAAGDPQIKSILLLSPGEDNRGVKTYEAARTFFGRSAMVLSSSGDPQSFNPSKQIVTLIGPTAKFNELQNAGHGTAMFDKDPSLENQITAFLQAN